MPRPILLLALLGAVLAVPACGGEDGTIDETDLRDCLVGEGAELRSAAVSGSVVAGTTAVADFRAELGGESVDVIVERTEEKAGRTAADLRSALHSYGVEDADRRLVEEANVVVLFGGDPSAEASAAVEGCLS